MFRLRAAVRNYGNYAKEITSSGRVAKKAIQISCIKQPRYAIILDFMNKYFLDDPMVKAMKVPRTPETYRVMNSLWTTTLDSGLSLQMCKRQILTDGRILGVCMSCVHDQEVTYKHLVKLLKSTKSQPLQNLLHAWSIITVQPKFTGLPKKSILEIAGIAVAKQFRQYGIANQLVHNAITFANLKGYQWIRVDCTSPYSAKICEKNGFHLIYEKSFKEFEGLGVTGDGNFKKKVKVFIKHLKKRKPKHFILPYRQI